MKLSIIVPVYNMAAEGKLEYCLNSLVAQTIGDYEIIAVDDCSTDDSWKILQDYQKRYPEKFCAIHSDVNQKQGGAKNIGMAAAQGEWIGFIDSDDWITPDFYERLIGKGEETGADMVGCDYHMTGEHSMKVGQVVPNNRPEQTGVLNEEKYRSLILDGGSLVVKVYRREIVIDHPSRFPTGIFYEDNALANSWMLRARHFEYIEEPLYYYYQHDTSTVHTITARRCEDRMEAGRIMLREAVQYGYLEKYRPDRLREQPHSGSGKPKYCMRGFGPTKEMQTAVYSVYLKSWGRRIICRRRLFCSALPALVRIRPIMTGLFRLLPVSFRNPSN